MLLLQKVCTYCQGAPLAYDTVERMSRCCVTHCQSAEPCVTQRYRWRECFSSVRRWLQDEQWHTQYPTISPIWPCPSDYCSCWQLVCMSGGCWGWGRKLRKHPMDQKASKACWGNKRTGAELFWEGPRAAEKRRRGAMGAIWESGWVGPRSMVAA